MNDENIGKLVVWTMFVLILYVVAGNTNYGWLGGTLVIIGGVAVTFIGIFLPLGITMLTNAKFALAIRGPVTVLPIICYTGYIITTTTSKFVETIQ